MEKKSPFAFFKKNAWVDTDTMIDLANAFVEHIRDKHNGLWVLIYCDHLTAHINNTVNSIFAAALKYFYVMFHLVLQNQLSR